MSGEENFLARWSRRKREAAVPDAAPEPQPATHSDTPAAQSDRPRLEASPSLEAEPAPAPVAEFDLAKLPSLDSITAATDMRAFMAPGVPAEITRAALRRAWEADPTIRNFVGLQENDWDFNKPNAVAGFGELPEGFDLKTMVAELFGERPVAEARAPGALQTERESPADRAEAKPASAPTPGKVEAEPITSQSPSSDPRTSFVQDNKDIATHNEPAGRRRHGGALPEL